MYTDSEREIVEFFDGKGKRKADPLRVWKRMTAAVAGRDLSLMLMQSSDTIKNEATGEFVKANYKDEIIEEADAALEDIAHATFGTKNIEDDQERGISTNEARTNLNDFLAWTSKKKATEPSTPTTSLPSQEPTPSA